MKNVLNKMLAALVIAASATSLCAPAYAEEAPARAEEMYTVTEDEQGTVTIMFNEPIVLSREESYAEDGAEEDGGIMPCGDVCYDHFPEKYWGNYTSTGGSFTLSIQGDNTVSFDGRHNFDGPNNFWHVYCDSENSNLEGIIFYPYRNKSNGLVLDFNNYTIINSSGNVYKTDGIKINGWYETKGGYFVIAGINYHLDK